MLHELAVDRSGSFELLGRAAKRLPGLEELLFQLGNARRQPSVGEPGDEGVGQEAIGGQAVAFGTREPVLEEADLTA